MIGDDSSPKTKGLAHRQAQIFCRKIQRYCCGVFVVLLVVPALLPVLVLPLFGVELFVVPELLVVPDVLLPLVMLSLIRVSLEPVVLVVLVLSLLVLLFIPESMSFVVSSSVYLLFWSFAFLGLDGKSFGEVC